MKKYLCRSLNIALFGTLLLPSHGFSAVDRDRLEDSDFTRIVTIVYNGDAATVSDVNNAGVTVARGTVNSDVLITSSAAGVEYVLSGASSTGCFQLTSDDRCKIVLDGVSLTATDGPALSVLSGEDAFLVLETGTSNVLVDSTDYTRTGKSTLYTEGNLLVSGDGSLDVTSNGGHGIYTKGYTRIFDGDITISAAASDAIHPKTYFCFEGGILNMTPTGDGVDASSGIVINGGRISFNSAEADVKGIKTDGTLDILGGTISATVAGDQSKALSADGDITVSGGALFLNLSGNVVLEEVTDDSVTYTDPSYCTGIKSDGNLIVQGGTIDITHTGMAGKGISINGALTVSGGSFDICVSGDASEAYVDEDGLSDTATAAAIKADGNISISDGSFALSLQGTAAKGLSTDTTLTVSGGSFAISASGDQSKGFKSDGAMNLEGGSFAFDMSGGVVLEASGSYYDPSYCTAIKANGDLTVSGGTFSITHTGTAGKGVSVDGSIVMTGGSFNITTSGGVSSSYTNTDGELDMASADCFKADGDLTITGGTLVATSTGTGGDAISCDGAAIIGVLGVDSTPVINATTEGVHVLLSGSGESADYVNAKAFKAEGDLTMNGGSFTATTSTDGGEGMESKANLTINGGTIEINSYDDSINAATSITINGGSIYCYASNNDAIDSNGTLTITGGTVVASGATSPEEGFDCDNNTFTITGGTIVGVGGDTSTPTSSVCTQRSVIYSGSGTSGTVLEIKSSSGVVLVYKLPRSYSSSGGPGGFGGPGGMTSSSMKLLFSSSALVSGTTYTILSGATVSGGTEFHGLYTGATVSGGSTVTTFTPSSMVTTAQ